MPDATGAGADGLTVGQVAARLGVTVRALHHWDEIGLARPSLRTAAGYRLYTPADLERLHRIVVYRELGLGLGRIRAVLDDSAADVPAALRAQRARIAERIARLRELDAGLARMIGAHERGPLLTPAQQAEVFGPGWDPEGPALAREKYGDTDQWRQYAERAAGRGPEEWRAVTGAVADFERELAAAMDAGAVPGGPGANRLAARHREVFAAYFPLTREMQVCLGRTYEADPGFAAHYDAIRPGLAGWFRRVIDAEARAHGVDPDTAAWR
ncbi:MerR family transcriptional regulator [Streptomyces termitum]|uniref:MerR family transcriptional regulator n=1 Tax=Streptomyces termitum TaxID=67368 RepID=UPI0033BF74E0